MGRVTLVARGRERVKLASANTKGFFELASTQNLKLKVRKVNFYENLNVRTLKRALKADFKTPDRDQKQLAHGLFKLASVASNGFFELASKQSSKLN